MTSGNWSAMKYVHLFLQGDLKFNKALFLFINDIKNDLEPENHLFVATQKNVYEECVKYYNNIIHDTKHGAELVNYYGSKADWIFIHALNMSYLEVAKIDKEIAGKVIWRNWGHDIREFWGVRNPLRFIKRFALNLIRLPNIRRFYGIGMGFKYDKVLLESCFGKVNTFSLPYRNLCFDFSTLTKDDHGDTIRIVVGHSANRTSNHQKILYSLSHFKDKPIKICLPLSYGDKENAKEVKKLAYELFSEDKIEVIEDFMTLDEYMQYLNNIDVAVLDIKGSAALGNYYALIRLKKKLYIARNGLIDYALNCEGIDHGYADEISRISFEEFKKPMTSFKAADEFTDFYDDKLRAYKQWHLLLDNLKKEENK